MQPLVVMLLLLQLVFIVTNGQIHFDVTCAPGFVKITKGGNQIANERFTINNKKQIWIGGDAYQYMLTTSHECWECFRGQFQGDEIRADMMQMRLQRAADEGEKQIKIEMVVSQAIPGPNSFQGQCLRNKAIIINPPPAPPSAARTEFTAENKQTVVIGDEEFEFVSTAADDGNCWRLRPAPGVPTRDINMHEMLNKLNAAHQIGTLIQYQLSPEVEPSHLGKKKALRKYRKPGVKPVNPNMEREGYEEGLERVTREEAHSGYYNDYDDQQSQIVGGTYYNNHIQLLFVIGTLIMVFAIIGVCCCTLCIVGACILKQIKAKETNADEIDNMYCV